MLVVGALEQLGTLDLIESGLVQPSRLHQLPETRFVAGLPQQAVLLIEQKHDVEPLPQRIDGAMDLQVALPVISRVAEDVEFPGHPLIGVAILHDVLARHGQQGIEQRDQHQTNAGAGDEA